MRTFRQVRISLCTTAFFGGREEASQAGEGKPLTSKGDEDMENCRDGRGMDVFALCFFEK